MPSRREVPSPDGPSFRYVRALEYSSSWNPTRKVFPRRIVGALRLPVGPMTTPSSASVTSAASMPRRLIVWTFLPFATMTFDAPSKTSAMSSLPNRCFLASTVSRTVASAPSMKESARLQLIQPLRW